MAKKIFRIVALLILLAPETSLTKLEFDSSANKVQLYGPYIKYNVLKEPYSIGRYQFATDEFRLEIVQEGGAEDLENSEEDDAPTPVETEQPQSTAEESASDSENSTIPTAQDSNEKKEEIQREPQSEPGEKKIYAVWPRFFLNFGKIKIITKKKRVLLKEGFEEVSLGQDEKYARLELKGQGDDLLEALEEPFQICLDQAFEYSRVKVCSDYFVYKYNQFQPVFKGENNSSALLNRKKTPKNAQISLDKKMKKVRVELRFKSGFYFYIRDKVRHLDAKNIVIDPRERRIGIVDGDGSVRPAQLTLKDRFFSFIKENNYFKNQYAPSQDWPQNLEDAEMEFAPYKTGASAQLFGIILLNAPPPFKFKLDDNNPIATYNRNLEITGTKDVEEILAARVENELFIHKDGKRFLWNFPAPKAGEINQNYLSLQHKGKDFYFSNRIFRAHQTNISASAALSTSQTLAIVPGYSFSAEHWFQEVWGKQSWSFQRWGVSASIYETLQGFKPSEDFPEKLSINPTNFDLLYRFSPGVRPVQSSFGAGVRFLNFKLFRSISSDLETRFLGIGAFWHTAPQKIIDDIFNIVPFFRYPKWMEISFFYYPLLLGNEQLGFSFSWQARGKMFFSKQWFLDASFNTNFISFKRAKISGVTPGFDSFNIGTAHGTIGVGYLFN